MCSNYIFNILLMILSSFDEVSSRPRIAQSVKTWDSSCNPKVRVSL